MLLVDECPVLYPTESKRCSYGNRLKTIMHAVEGDTYEKRFKCLLVDGSLRGTDEFVELILDFFAEGRDLNTLPEILDVTFNLLQLFGVLFGRLQQVSDRDDYFCA